MQMRNTLLLLALPFAFSLAGCDRGAPPASAPAKTAAAPASKRVTICLLPKKKGVPYFTSCANGAHEAVRELGDVDLIYDGPADGSPERAAGMIEKWTL